jgi:hypothetical protein
MASSLYERRCKTLVTDPHQRKDVCSELGGRTLLEGKQDLALGNIRLLHRFLTRQTRTTDEPYSIYPRMRNTRVKSRRVRDFAARFEHHYPF